MGVMSDGEILSLAHTTVYGLQTPAKGLWDSVHKTFYLPSGSHPCSCRTHTWPRGWGRERRCCPSFIILSLFQYNDNIFPASQLWNEIPHVFNSSSRYQRWGGEGCVGNPDSLSPGPPANMLWQTSIFNRFIYICQALVYVLYVPCPMLTLAWILWRKLLLPLFSRLGDQLQGVK